MRYPEAGGGWGGGARRRADLLHPPSRLRRGEGPEPPLVNLAWRHVTAPPCRAGASSPRQPTSPNFPPSRIRFKGAAALENHVKLS